MPELVIISDLHAHPWTAFSSGDGFNNSRFLQTLKVLDDSLSKAEELGCPWIFAGDLVHTAGYGLNVVLSGVVNVLRRHKKVEKVAVWGNHDARGVGGRITLEQTVWGSILPAVPKLSVLHPENSQSINLDGITVAGEGYQPRASFLNYGPGGDLGIFHQTVQGTRTPHGVILEGIDPEELAKRYEFSIVGHVHHSQFFSQGILVPGSPEHHNFGDLGDHGWWILDYTRGTDAHLTFIPGGSPEFRTVEDPAEIKDDGNFYRVTDVRDKGSLPLVATYVAPDVTTVHQRDLLRDATSVEQILQVWMNENPPPDDPEGYRVTGASLLESQDPVRMRNARVMSIRLQDFGSYQDTYFEFKDGVWLVTGKGTDFPSNGAGKTTLFEALFWLIFGKTTKGLPADDVVRRAPGVEGCSVTGLFHVDHQTLLVHRSRGARSGVEVRLGATQWEAPSATMMTDRLARFLGITPEMFKHLGYFSQEDVLLFASATDGERKNVLADLVGLAAYQVASSQAGEFVSSFEGMRSKVQAAREVHQENLDANEHDLLAACEAKDLWDSEALSRVNHLAGVLADLEENDPSTFLNHRLEIIQDRQRLLSAVYTKRLELLIPKRTRELFSGKVSAVERHRDTLELEASEIDRDIFAAFGVQGNMLIDSLPQLRESLEKAQKSAQENSEFEESAGKVAQRAMWEVTYAERDLLAAEKEREELLRSFNLGVCPTCGQKVSVGYRDQCIVPKDEKVALAKQRVETSKLARDNAQGGHGIAKRLLDEAQTLVQTLTDHIKRLETAKARRDRLQGIQEILNSLSVTEDALRSAAEAEAREETAKVISSYLERKRKRMDGARSFVNKHIAAHRALYDSKRRELDSLNQQRNPHESTVTILTERKQAALDGISAQEEKTAHFTHQIAIYDYWKRGFSKQGIQSLLMEEIAAVFNKTRGKIIPLMAQGVYDVQFSTISRTRSGELREKTEFQVTEYGIPVPYESLSGGEKRRVDLGIMLTLSVAVSEWMRVQGMLGVLVLDEVFSFLDGSGAEGLLEALREVQRVIPSVYTITHDSALQSMFPEVVMVEKDGDGVSRVVA